MELFQAVINGDIYQLQEILMENPDIDLDQPLLGNMTALHVACDQGFVFGTKALLSSGADINKRDGEGYTPLMHSILAGFPNIVWELLKKNCDCNFQTPQRMTALHYAAKQGNSHLVQLLLLAGAHVERLDCSGQSPLSIALQSSNLKVVQSLLLGCRYVDLNTFSYLLTDQEPLYLQLRRGEFKIATTLLMAGYRGRTETFKFMSSVPQLLSNFSPEADSLKTIAQHTAHPWSLQHLCRLSIRRTLNFNIWKKTDCLDLPPATKDYIMFRDVYNPPELSTGGQVHAAFSEISSEFYNI